MNDDSISVGQDLSTTNSMKPTTLPPTWPSATTTTTHGPHSPDYPADLLSSLRQHSLFQRTNNEEFLTKLASKMHLRLYNPRDIIITKGETSKAMFFLLRGQVEVCSADFERTYATLSQGACFGEIGILYARPRTATVVASLKCTVAALTSEQVHTLLPQFPDVEKIIRFEAEERLAMMDKVEKSGQDRRGDAHVGPQQQLDQSSNETTPVALTPDDSDHSRRSSIQYNVESFSRTGIRNSLDKVTTSARIGFYSITATRFCCRFHSSSAAQKTSYTGSACPSSQGDTIQMQSSIVKVTWVMKCTLLSMVSSSCTDQGKRGTNLKRPMLFAGYVDVDAKGNCMVYGRMGPGGYFGDSSIFFDLPRVATVKTVEQVELYVLNRTEFQRVCDLYPDVAARLKKLTGTRLNDFTRGKLDDFSGKNETSHLFSLSLKAVLLPLAGIRPSSLNEDRPSQTSECRTTCDQDPTLPITPATQLRKAETRKRRASIAVWNDPILSQKVQQHSMATDSSIDGYQKQDDNDFNRDDNYSLEQSNRRNLKLPPSPSWTTSPRLASLPSPYRDGDDLFDLNRPKSPPVTSADRFTTLGPTILIRIMDLLDFGTLVQMMRLSRPIQAIFTLDQALNHVDLSTLHKKITDDSFASLMAVMPRRRLRSLSLSQCFHLTDAGLRFLLEDKTTPLHSPLASPTFLQHLEKLDLNSCWLLTDLSLQRLGERCPHLTHLNISNCRKITNDGMYRFLNAKHGSTTMTTEGLAWLSVSYCKNLTDVTMQHLADFCRHSLTYLNLQRCTKITDQGFLRWTAASFPRLKELLLVDCSFLTDRSIQCLTQAAPGLERLSLSFCCSLSDSAMYHLGHLDSLVDVDASFCGAAVSDVSLPLLGRHLERLNIRGCVRVTGDGLLTFLRSFPLIELNISQCPSIPLATRQQILDLALVQHLIF